MKITQYDRSNKKPFSLARITLLLCIFESSHNTGVYSEYKEKEY